MSSMFEKRYRSALNEVMTSLKSISRFRTKEECRMELWRCRNLLWDSVMQGNAIPAGKDWTGSMVIPDGFFKLIEKIDEMINQTA